MKTTIDTDAIIAQVQAELNQTLRKHGTFRSYHEGLGVLLEEVHELSMEIYRKDLGRDPRKLKDEAIQVAAMGAKLALLAQAEIEAPKRRRKP